MRCPEKTEVWSRVCGFFRPVAQWNRGKRQEYEERKNYVVAPASPSGGAVGDGANNGRKGESA